MSIRAYQYAWEIIAAGELPATAGLVLLRLADHHNGKTGQCDPTIRTIATGTGLSVGAVHNAISRLETSGVLAVVRAGHRRHNRYRWPLEPTLEVIHNCSPQSEQSTTVHCSPWSEPTVHPGVNTTVHPGVNPIGTEPEDKSVPFTSDPEVTTMSDDEHYEVPGFGDPDSARDMRAIGEHARAVGRERAERERAERERLRAENEAQAQARIAARRERREIG